MLSGKNTPIQQAGSKWRGDICILHFLIYIKCFAAFWPQSTLEWPSAVHSCLCGLSYLIYFLIGNLSYSPSCQPSRTVLFLEVMYTTNPPSGVNQISPNGPLHFNSSMILANTQSYCTVCTMSVYTIHQGESFFGIPVFHNQAIVKWVPITKNIFW